MGQTEAKQEPFAKEKSLFNSTELQRIRKLCVDARKGNQECGMTQNTLKNLLMKCFHHSDEILTQRLFWFMTSIKEDQMDDNIASIRQVSTTLGILLRGTVTEKSELLMFLATAGNGVCTVVNNVVLLANILVRGLLTILSRSEECAAWRFDSDGNRNLLVVSLIQELVEKNDKDRVLHCRDKYEEISNKVVTLFEIEQWLMRCSFLSNAFDLIWSSVFKVKSEQTGENPPAPLAFPVCDRPLDCPRGILNDAAVLYLNHHLPKELKTTWRLLFHSNLHGESFTTLLKHVADKGPLLIVVKDTDDYIFGAFASVAVTLKPQWDGSSSSFLFSAHPNLQVYATSGYNTNYQYANYGQETMPNGIGFGGQFEYFGLWLDAAYGQGHSRTKTLCTTYNSPVLSAQENFKIDTLEIYGVGEVQSHDEDEEVDGEASGAKRSILDKDAGARALLEMAGKASHSAGLREENEAESDAAARTVIALH